MEETKDLEAVRARGRELHAEFAARGDAVGWFEALYKEADGDNTRISWADLEPNSYFRAWAEKAGLKGSRLSAFIRFLEVWIPHKEVVMFLKRNSSKPHHVHDFKLPE